MKLDGVWLVITRANTSTVVVGARGRGVPISSGPGYSLNMQAPRIRLRAPETTARESDQQETSRKISMQPE